MDPIKVDFSKKGGPKEIVIPPDKAVLKIVLSVLCSLVTTAIAFYIMLPTSTSRRMSSTASSR